MRRDPAENFEHQRGKRAQTTDEIEHAGKRPMPRTNGKRGRGRTSADAGHLDRAETHEPEAAVRIARAFRERHRRSKTERAPAESLEKAWKYAQTAHAVDQRKPRHAQTDAQRRKSGRASGADALSEPAHQRHSDERANCR